MSDERSTIRWHYGFYAAMKAEYGDKGLPMDVFDQEVPLGVEPVRLDMVIKTQGPLSDPLGSFYRVHNVHEYKSPDDSLSVDEFYRALTYPLHYKYYDHKVNEIPLKDLTLTIVRHSYPREMIKTLEADGFKVKLRKSEEGEEYQGIYEVSGKLPVPTQIVVTSRLPDGEYEALKLLSTDATPEMAADYIEKVNSSSDEMVQRNGGSVIYYCLLINPGMEQKLKDLGINVEVMKEMLQQVIDEERKDAEKVGEQKKAEKVAEKMIRENYSATVITHLTDLSFEDVARVAQRIGATVALV